MYTIKDFITLISELIHFFTELNAVEKEKLNFSLQQDIFGLEEIMKKEQACLLKLRGLDKKRETIQTALSFQGMSFREILTHVQGEEQKTLSKLFQELQQQYSLYLSTSDSTKRSIELNLHQLEPLLKSKSAPAGNVYSSDGNIKTTDKPKFTSRKV